MKQKLTLVFLTADWVVFFPSANDISVTFAKLRNNFSTIKDAKLLTKNQIEQLYNLNVDEMYNLIPRNVMLTSNHLSASSLEQHEENEHASTRELNDTSSNGSEAAVSFHQVECTPQDVCHCSDDENGDIDLNADYGDIHMQPQCCIDEEL